MHEAAGDGGGADAKIYRTIAGLGQIGVGRGRDREE
jgi:hypothetical protein